MVDSAELAALANQLKGKGQKKERVPKKKANTEDDVLDQPCQVHTKKDAEGNLVLPKHTTRQCRLLRKMISGKDGQSDDKTRRMMVARQNLPVAFPWSKEFY